MSSKSSKQLSSILSTIPSATIEGQKRVVQETNDLDPINPSLINKHLEDTDRIVAVIPKVLKDEIREYLRLHKGCTERIVLLKALKLLGFNVKAEWLIDKRTQR